MKSETDRVHSSNTVRRARSSSKSPGWLRPAERRLRKAWTWPSSIDDLTYRENGLGGCQVCLGYVDVTSDSRQVQSEFGRCRVS